MEIVEILLETCREGWMINRAEALSSLKLFRSTFIIKNDKNVPAEICSSAATTGLGDISDLSMNGESLRTPSKEAMGNPGDSKKVGPSRQMEEVTKKSLDNHKDNSSHERRSIACNNQQHRSQEEKLFDRNYGGPFYGSQKIRSSSHNFKHAVRIDFFDLGAYKQWVKDPTPFYDVSVQREILQEAQAVLEESGFECLRQMPSNHNLLERRGWRQCGHAELQEFHKMWPPACLDESKLFLHPCETKDYIWTTLREVQQVRHSNAHHTVNIPIVMIRQMLDDNISLTKMLGHKQAWKSLNKILQKLEVEAHWNFKPPSPIQCCRNKLRRIAKKYDRNESENGYLAKELNHEAKSKNNEYRDRKSIDRQYQDCEYSSLKYLPRKS
ncbi:uncharacterized protein EAF01_009310 [Botrytis porri]|uniref:uncharacterized protein n=1 Tax=Botrytis porri TaxID=87229 RepID=UPI0019001DC9|nr:uncharacterized protein EAF01_009310 [Botrytis porri]KAF7896907.1 hypothetical protein EAF01_009310 [Botrytis porri]